MDKGKFVRGYHWKKIDKMHICRNRAKRQKINSEFYRKGVLGKEKITPQMVRSYGNRNVGVL